MVSYFYPDDLKEALKIRSDQAVIPLAGGTDLMVRYENWSSLPPSFPGNIMGISHLKELKDIHQDKDFRNSFAEESVKLRLLLCGTWQPLREISQTLLLRLTLFLP